MRPGRIPDLVNLVPKFSCASNLACLHALVLERHPSESVGQSVCYLLLNFRKVLFRTKRTARITNFQQFSNFCATCFMI